MSPQNITIFPLVNLVFYLTARSDELEKQYQTLWNAVDDKIGLEAIRSLHQQLDDDKDGSIEPSETGDFIKVDLQVGFNLLTLHILGICMEFSGSLVFGFLLLGCPINFMLNILAL